MSSMLSDLPFRWTSRSPDDAGARNMLLLTQLRWLAIAGQMGAIIGVWRWMEVPLPVAPMMAILAGLTLANLAMLVALRRGWAVSNAALFLSMLMDWAALTAQLYLSGGATNPFAPIGLLQVVLGAVLLETWSAWALVLFHGLGFGALTLFHEPLELPPPYASHLSVAHVLAGWLNFGLVSVLLVLFIMRISRNSRERDARLAEMRQRQAEEDHIVRMGLLASGAAHELGTPLSSMSVILGDWRKLPALARDRQLAEEIVEMQAAVARCKDILTGILYASGEARSEAVERSSLLGFLVETAQAWDRQRPGLLTFHDRLDRPVAIVADRILAQVIYNLLDNAAEAGARHIALEAAIADGQLQIIVSDDGPGFQKDMLETVGKPYRSSKARRGAGLGLFLAVNVMRKLGGEVIAANAAAGACVTLRMPLASLTLETADDRTPAHHRG